MSDCISKFNVFSTKLNENKKKLENLVKRKFIVNQAFEIYGGTSGLYDYGPVGANIKSEIEKLWKKHFVIKENMFLFEGTALTPCPVLEASGHVERFTDIMLEEDLSSQEANMMSECFRADKFVESWVDERLKKGSQDPQLERTNLLEIKNRVSQMTSSEIDAVIQNYSITSPRGFPFLPSYPFNLMFSTNIGPKASTPSFLRPETAQGIFVNFKRFLEYNRGAVPFAVAQLGSGFRNEISPRNGLLRAREFQMAEIEHFVDPKNKSHKNFCDIAHLKLPLYPVNQQMANSNFNTSHLITEMSLNEAVEKKIIDNETLAYFLGRTFLFLKKCGIKTGEGNEPIGVRFRQHLKTEMAHYAADCWDAEIFTSTGWTEVVGHADRSAFDITQHSIHSKTDLFAKKKLEQPVLIEGLKFIPNRKELANVFGSRKQNIVVELLNSKTLDEKKKLNDELRTTGRMSAMSSEGELYEITEMMGSFSIDNKIEHEESFIPAVIEPSFGIGRLFHCILEHCFVSREIEDQELRSFLSLPPVIAPSKCIVLDVVAKPEFSVIIAEIVDFFRNSGIAVEADSSGTAIGRRYARADEIGIPFAITVDFETLQNRTVTLRNRDCMSQIRLPLEDVKDELPNLIYERNNWDILKSKYESVSKNDDSKLTNSRICNRISNTWPLDSHCKLSKSIFKTFEERLKVVLDVAEECVSPEQLAELLYSKEHPLCYDGFEPSGRMHIAQGIMKVLNVNRLTSSGCIFVFWIADWFAMLNQKFGGDLEKIRLTGLYFIEVWKAVGMKMENVRFIWASEQINKSPDKYWKLVMNIAVNNTISRIKRCSQIMGRSEGDGQPAAQILYPCMQCADIFFLDADICQLGMDQRKVNVLAREYAEAKDLKKPVILSHSIIPGLLEGQPKMSKSNAESAIFMEDSEEQVAKKIRKAFCPPQQLDPNPCIVYMEKIVLPYFEQIEIKTHDTTIIIDSCEMLRTLYSNGSIHPGDLKATLTRYINLAIEPVRSHFRENPEASLILKKVREFTA